jgi:hypothetical protein
MSDTAKIKLRVKLPSGRIDWVWARTDPGHATELLNDVLQNSTEITSSLTIRPRTRGDARKGP